ncbi:unnamed protein product [[Candida] boidinii]|nr:unnamed protein product [[Candida] boidinii]
MPYPIQSKREQIEEDDLQQQIPETQDYFGSTGVHVDCQMRNVPAYTEKPDYESEDAAQNKEVSDIVVDVLPSFEMHNFMFNRSMFEDMSPNNELPSYGQVDCSAASRCPMSGASENSSTRNNSGDLTFIQSYNNDSTQYENTLTTGNFRNPDEFY